MMAWLTRLLGVEHLEREIEYLRGHNAMLLLRLTEALKPTQPAPVAPRQFPKTVPPARTSWEQFVADDIARQEREAREKDKNGTHSSGRIEMDQCKPSAQA